MSKRITKWMNEWMKEWIRKRKDNQRMKEVSREIEETYAK